MRGAPPRQRLSPALGPPQIVDPVERLDRGAIDDPDDDRADLAGRDGEHRVIQEGNAALDLAHIDEGLAPAQSRHGREIRLLEPLGDGGRALEQHQCRCWIALTERSKALRHQEVPAHDAVDPALLDHPLRARKPATGDRHVASVHVRHPEPEREVGREVRVTAPEGALMPARHQRGSRIVVSAEVRCQSGLAEVGRAKRAFPIGGRIRLRGFPPRTAGEGGAGLVQVGRGRHGQFWLRGHSTAPPARVTASRAAGSTASGRSARWPSGPGSRRTTARCPRPGSGRSCRRCWRSASAAGG